MSILTTDRDNVALYDSVTGTAFGPVFADTEHAEDFQRWAKDRLGPELGYDLRELNAATLASFHRDWFAERCDAETGILLETA